MAAPSENGRTLTGCPLFIASPPACSLRVWVLIAASHLAQCRATASALLPPEDVCVPLPPSIPEVSFLAFQEKV